MDWPNSPYVHRHDPESENPNNWQVLYEPMPSIMLSCGEADAAAVYDELNTLFEEAKVIDPEIDPGNFFGSNYLGMW
jgi:hypothetical protein